MFQRNTINLKIYMKYKTIILDRDGVINEVRDDYVKTKSDLEYIPGSIKAIINCFQSMIAVSNQAPWKRPLSYKI